MTELVDVDLNTDLVELADQCATWKSEDFKKLENLCMEYMQKGLPIPRIYSRLNHTASIANYEKSRDLFFTEPMKSYYQCSYNEMVKLASRYVSLGRFDLLDMMKNDFPDFYKDYTEDFVNNGILGSKPYFIDLVNENIFAFLIKEGRVFDAIQEIIKNHTSHLYIKISTEKISNLIREKICLNDVVSLIMFFNTNYGHYSYHNIHHLFNYALKNYGSDQKLIDPINGFLSARTASAHEQFEDNEKYYIEIAAMLFNHFDHNQFDAPVYYKNCLDCLYLFYDFETKIKNDSIKIIHGIMNRMAEQGLIDWVVKLATPEVIDYAKSLQNSINLGDIMSSDPLKIRKRPSL